MLSRQSQSDTTALPVVQPSIFYYISKASNCVFWDERRHNIKQHNVSSFETHVAVNRLTDFNSGRCCRHCQQLLHLLQIEVANHSISSVSQSTSYDRTSIGQPEELKQHRFLLSQVTGGTILHSLLQFYNQHCPQLVTSMILHSMRSTDDDVPVLSVTMMLLHRDRCGNLPIHIAAMTTSMPNHTIRLLLRHTLLAQQRQQQQMTARISHLLLGYCYTPFIASRNLYGRSILDIALEQYIIHGNDVGNDKHRAISYRLFDWQHCRETVRQAVDQTIQNTKAGSHCDFTVGSAQNPLIQRIKAVICAAYYEMSMLQQFHRVHSNRFDDRRQFDDRDRSCLFGFDAGTMSTMREEEEINFEVHYASALTGPVNMFTMHDVRTGTNGNGGYRPRCCVTETKSLNMTTRPSPPSSNPLILQVDRYILDLLLHHCGIHVLQIRHPITGQVPLHYAVQSQCFFDSPTGNHDTSCEKWCGKHANNDVKKRTVYDEDWLQWIRTLLRIYPEACMIKNRHGHIPIHDAILQTCHDCDCQSGRSNIGSNSDNYCRAISLSRYRIIHALIAACPPSIEIPYPLLWIAAAESTPMKCHFEMYQIAAMVYHPPYNNNFDMLLTTIYTVLRLAPSRLFVVPPGEDYKFSRCASRSIAPTLEVDQTNRQCLFFKY